MRYILDFFFPPLCRACKAHTRLPLFCSTCWKLCSPIDPVGRCERCFAETDSDFCFSCRRMREHLPFFRASVFEPTRAAYLLCREKGETLAGFVLHQWVQLEWEIPDIILAMPGMESIAKAFASFLNAGSAFPHPFYSKRDLSLFEEGQTFLLLDDRSSLRALRKASYPLMQTFPKKIFQLSLMEHVDSSFH